MMPPGDDAPPPALSHLNDRGEAHMVDVSAKAVTARIARAGGFVRMQAATLDLIESGVFDRIGIASTLCTAGADFTGIASASSPLCVGQAQQQAVLRVAEEGTVAAAVTEIGVVFESAMPEPTETVDFDRPFLFTINHDATDWPLFQAANHDPRH